MIEYNEAIKVLEKNIEQQKKTEEIHILDSYGYIVADNIVTCLTREYPIPVKTFDKVAAPTIVGSKGTGIF